VRAIVNRSSGRMGYAIAAAARDAGARVTLAGSGPVALPAPGEVRVLAVETAAQMLAAVESEVGGCDIFISVAAVADYHWRRRRARKIKRDGRALRAGTRAQPGHPGRHRRPSRTQLSASASPPRARTCWRMPRAKRRR
jgi:phosphopantothenoylcysteine decarboxylase/phosphopantothenate--cysteine ligase